MDANGQRFYLLAEDQSWARLSDPPHVAYDQNRRSLRLASERPLPAKLPGAPSIDTLRRRAAQAVDEFGTRAYWDAPTQTVRGAGALPGSVSIYVPLPGQGT